MRPFWVRSFVPGDAPALGQVFHRAVHEGAAGEYDEAERAAWSPAAPEGEAWAARLGGAETVVADDGAEPLGFMTLDLASGVLDLAFVLPEVRGQGVAEALHAVIECRARRAGLARLTAEVSLTAERFFARQGWRVAARQVVERRGVRLRNARMEKRLAAVAAA